MNEENIQQISRSTSAISEWSFQLLSGFGIPESWVNFLNLILLTLGLVVLVFIVQYLTRKILQAVLNRTSRFSGTTFIKHLSERRFAHFLAMIIPFSLVKGSIPIIYVNHPKLMVFLDKLADIFLIFYVIWLVMAIINAFTDKIGRA